MKTPEEIKKGLEAPIGIHYHDDPEPRLTPRLLSELIWLHDDALAYIQRLEEQNAELVKKMEQLKEGTLFTLVVKEQDVKNAVKKAYESMEIDGKTLPEWIKLLADYKRHEWISAKEPPLEWKDADGKC